jgi:hypothetical protein
MPIPHFMNIGAKLKKLEVTQNRETQPFLVKSGTVSRMLAPKLPTLPLWGAVKIAKIIFEPNPETYVDFSYSNYHQKEISKIEAKKSRPLPPLRVLISVKYIWIISVQFILYSSLQYVAHICTRDTERKREKEKQTEINQAINQTY